MTWLSFIGNTLFSAVVISFIAWGIGIFAWVFAYRMLTEYIFKTKESWEPLDKPSMWAIFVAFAAIGWGVSFFHTAKNTDIRHHHEARMSELQGEMNYLKAEIERLKGPNPKPAIQWKMEK